MGKSRNGTAKPLLPENHVLDYLRAQGGRPQSLRTLEDALGIPSGQAKGFGKLLRRLEDEGRVYRVKGNKYQAVAEAGAVARPGLRDALPGRDDNGPRPAGPRPGSGPARTSGGRLGAGRHERGRDNGKGGRNRDERRRRGSGVPEGDRPGDPGVLKGKLIRQAGFHFVAPIEPGRREVRPGKRDKEQEENLILIPKKHLGKARPGDIVSVRILEDDDGERTGRILASLSQAIPFSDVSKAFFKEYMLPSGYSKRAMQEAAEFPEPVWEALEGRKDMRHVYVVTIDPSTAKDHDDAISLERKGGNWSLGVHIADVSEYVRPDSDIDNEALKRAFTQYLPWTAVPMLPQRLSSDLCSLLEHRERLAFTCFMEVGPDGELLDFHFAETFIRVAKFYSYEEAQAVKEAGDPFLRLMDEFTTALLAKRRRDGFIDFQFPEPKVELDEGGIPARIYPGQRLASHSWIEECMLLANQATARFLTKHKLPGLFRVHEQPDLDAVADLWTAQGIAHQDKGMVDAFKNLDQTRGYLNPAVQKFFIRLLSQEGGALPAAVQRKILQSMKKAQYSSESLGHFALGWLDYAHFTSPIRRYADLWTHRVIKHFIRNGKVPKHMKTEAPEVGDRVSEREIAVMKVERKGLKTATAWILRQYIGEEFIGEVSGMENFGIFVSIQDPFGEGLIPINRMRDDYYEKDEDTGHLVGKRTRTRFQLGDKLKVRLERSDPFSAQVDFEYLGRA